MKVHLHNLLIVIAGFLTPVVPFFLLTGLFIFLDTVFGVWAAKKVGEKITSTKMSNVLYKSLVYMTLVLVAFILDKFLFGEIFKLFIDIELVATKIVMITIVFNEVYSIEEKIRKVKGEEGGLKAMFLRAFRIAKDIKAKKDEF